MNGALRKFLGVAHARAGLVAGLLLLIISLSGAAISILSQWRAASWLSTDQGEAVGPRLSLDSLVLRAATIHPQSQPVFLRFFSAPGAPVSVRFADSDIVFLEPRTGAAMEKQNFIGRVYRVTESIHKLEFLPAGGAVAGGIALTCLFLVATGAVLWWTGARFSKAGLPGLFRLKGRGKWLQLHKTTGVCAALFVGVSAFTGLPQAFDWMRLGLYRLTGSAVPQAPVLVESGPSNAATLPINRLAELVAARVPNARETLIRFPVRGVVTIFCISATAPHALARSYLYLDAVTGAELAFVPYEQCGLGHQVYLWMLAMHLGEVGGIAGRWALLLGALSLPVLGATGAVSFLRKKIPGRLAAA